ncbi:MAG: DUF4278 domain-containing protein [Hydrococcus sp. Prado102]|jgi:hypothetical protein|nr:DUF4278 domain-containing protein [Hydrococcus sp. Prado102]
MQLRYRGVAYDSTSNLESSVETDLTASFRGQTYRVRRPLGVSHCSHQMLVYRGIPYTL